MSESPVPVRLPAAAITKPVKSRRARRGHAESILAPGEKGHTITSGEGSVQAGEHHAPRVSVGAVGAVTGYSVGFAAGATVGAATAVTATAVTIVPFISILVAPAACGYVVAKGIARKRHTIQMLDEHGQEVNVKLWKAGRYAPLTEEGYWLVASDERHSEMAIFMHRVIESMGGTITDVDSWCRLSRAYSGKNVSSLASMRARIQSAPWVSFSDSLS